jgi:1-acyl-sn-glycerol-3-phosphate acyltransferase
VPRLAKRRKLGRPAHNEKLGLIWCIVGLVLYGPASALIRTRYRHLERIPAEGPAILVTNHVSHIDPFLVAKLVIDAGRTPRFLAKDSIFDVFAVGPAMRGMGHIPVSRGTTDARQSLDAAVQALAAGRVVVLHPEGTVTRDPDGWPMNGKSGAARLAMLAPEVPVIPVAQWGVQRSVDLYRKKVKLVPRPRHELSVGTPLDLGPERREPMTIGRLNSLTDTIVKRLRTDVAELRALPSPTGELFVWTRPNTDGD